MKTCRLAFAAISGGALPPDRSLPTDLVAGISFSDGTKSIFGRLAWLAVVSASFLANAFAATASPVNLLWNANPETDIASYEVSYGLSSGVYSGTVNVGANTTAALSGLAEGNTYYFVVSAYNQAGLKSPPSAEISQWVAITATDYLSQSGWALKYVDSQEAADYPATYAFDGNPNTFWHTQWRTSTMPLPPHDIQIDMGAAQNLRGFRYLPRQDGYFVGNIGQFEFYVSTDGIDWGNPVATGTFANTSAEKEILFTPKIGRFIRLRALTAANGGTECNIADLKVLPQLVDTNTVNQAPVATGKTVTTAEDTPLAIALTASDANGDALTYSVVTSPTKGTLSGTAPNLTYSPAADFNGTDSFTFKANDGSLDSAVATVSITITPVNDAPSAVAKTLTTAEDTALSVVLSGSDIDGNPLTYAVVSSPVNGTLSGIAPNLTYLPTTNFNGSDSFTYRVNDGSVNSAIATVSITVSPVNDAPLAVSKTVSTKQNTSVAVTLAGSDIEGSPLTYAIVTGPTNGILTGIAPNLTFVPTANFNGTDQFTYRTNDGTANSATVTVSITVTKKVLSTDGNLIPPTGWTLKYVDSEEALDYPATFAFDGNPDTFWHTKWRSASLPLPPHEIQINLGATQSINGFRYLPRQDSPSVGNIGQYEFYVSMDGVNWGNPVATGTFANTKDEKEILFTAKNGKFVRLRELTEANGGSECSMAELNLLQGNAANQAPTATAQSVTTAEDTPLEIMLSGSDPEDSSLSFSISSSPAHGQLTGSPPNLTYLPDADFNGSDQFTFLVNDGAANSTTATVSISVTPVAEVPGNIAPVFGSNRILASATEDETFTGQLTATDENPGDTLTYSKVSGPQWLSVSSSGELGGTPLNGNVGTNSFSVKVTDGSKASATAVLIITVANTNDAPVFKLNPMPFPSASETVAYTYQTLAGSATDPDKGDAITYSKTSGPAWLVVSSTGTLGGTPPADSAGMDQFTIRATDSDGAFCETVLQIQVLENSLPLPWSVDRVGRKYLAGGAKYSAGSFTLMGAGAPTKTTDAGNFGWQTLTGDGEITARVKKSGNTGKDSLVGIMIRESLAPNSRQIFLGANGKGDLSWLRRKNTGGNTAETSSSNPNRAKTWLRLVRKGDTITAYKSSNGDQWTVVGKPVSIDLPKNCYIGISVSSGNNDELNTSVFSNVSVTP
ncbi:MAG: Ig-like domain-containing protein [Luteolibacter sp.]